MLIAGAKNHAKEIVQILEAIGTQEVCFFYDDISENTGNLFLNTFKIITSEIEAKALFRQNPEFILGLGRPKNRSIMTDKLINCGGKLVSLIAPTALVGTYDVNLGDGLNIMHASMISNSVRVDKGTLINAFVSVHHDVTIGSFCELAPHAVILGGCTIGNYTSIGANATVLPNVSIGNRVTVGAGALVNKDLPDDCLALGVPARIIRQK